MDPLAAVIPERLIGDDTFIAHCPAFRPPRMNCQWLLRRVMLFTQPTRAEAADNIPCALDPPYRSPHPSSCRLSVGHCSEKRPADVYLRGDDEVGTTSAERVPAADAAVVCGAHIIVPSLVTVHRGSTACADSVGANPSPDVRIVVSASCGDCAGTFMSSLCGETGHRLGLGSHVRQGTTATPVTARSVLAGSARGQQWRRWLSTRTRRASRRAARLGRLDSGVSCAPPPPVAHVAAIDFIPHPTAARADHS